MSMRNHQIESSYDYFDIGEEDEVSRRVSKPARPEIRVRKSEIESDDSNMMYRVLGQAMIRTGIAILAVPDPIPIVDEVVGMSLVGTGAAVLYLER